MSNSIEMKFAVVLLVSAMICAHAHGSSVKWNCFRIEPGYIPHVICTLEDFTAINFAVDDYGADGWEVVQHATSRSKLYVKNAQEGEIIADGSIGSKYTITGTGESFLFAFTWDSDYHGNGGYNGWMRLTTSNGELLIAQSAFCTNRGEPITVGVIPEPSCAALLLFGTAALALRRPRQ